MKRRPVALASLALLACAPVVVFVACSGGDDSASVPPGADAAPPGDGSPGPGSDGSQPLDAGADVGPRGDTGTPVGADGATADAGGDSGDSGQGCAAVTATPIVVSGTISTSTTWTCNNVYLVQGTVEVLNPGVDYSNAGVDAGGTPTTVLTIEAGTTVLMSNDAHNNGNLLVLPGARLNAVGTSDLPIVFTSQALNTGASPAPGDWGAVVLTGWAPGNYGANGPDGGAVMQNVASTGNDWFNGGNGDLPFQAGSYDPSHNADSSGTLKYVRMEYGGVVRSDPIDAGYQPTNHEMLGIYGAGSGTTLSYVDMRQVLFGCVFAEGGQFLADHIICQYHGQSGGFDVSRGNQTKAQFVLVQESPNFTSEGIGYKGPSGSEQLPPLTAPTIYNATVCGSFGGAAFEDPAAFFMNRAPSGYLANFIGTGYYGGLLMQGDLTDGGLFVPAPTQMVSSILWDNFDPSDPDAGTSNIYDPSTSVPQPDYTNLAAWFAGQPNNSSTTNPNITTGCQNPNALQVGPPASLTTGAATPPSDGFFDPTATYIGAFKDSTDTWATGKWVKWSAE